ncbi:hypothetical protein EAO70_20785 [Streptomyces sp. adm13(2018)]|uniref:hypothetical protein n=1 Tax=Streptomyces sp. adm13(2018) TaxID=2479007 RepID=UPI0011CDBA02|nr:hypothetical protein [Streptomyces sp. adm13(2018)]TXS14021.1 hypothetical protein EAO70_20785 [Streptomyces sp. adm13(2018)]
MTDYLRCPAPHCTHHVHITATTSKAAEDITDHLIDKHQFPEVSASYQADLLLPITGPHAA